MTLVITARMTSWIIAGEGRSLARALNRSLVGICNDIS